MPAHMGAPAPTHCPRVVEQASGLRLSRQASRLPHACGQGANLEAWRDERKPVACSTMRRGRCAGAPAPLTHYTMWGYNTEVETFA